MVIEAGLVFTFNYWQGREKRAVFRSKIPRIPWIGVDVCWIFGGSQIVPIFDDLFDGLTWWLSLCFGRSSRSLSHSTISYLKHNKSITFSSIIPPDIYLHSKSGMLNLADVCHTSDYSSSRQLLRVTWKITSEEDIWVEINSYFCVLLRVRCVLLREKKICSVYLNANNNVDSLIFRILLTRPKVYHRMKMNLIRS